MPRGVLKKISNEKIFFLGGVPRQKKIGVGCRDLKTLADTAIRNRALIK